MKKHENKKKNDPGNRYKKLKKKGGLKKYQDDEEDEKPSGKKSLKRALKKEALRKKYNTAAAAPPPPPPKTPQEKLWDYWFDLQKAAARKDWKTVERKLDANKKSKLEHHRFTMQLFEQAALAGKVHIVEEMFKRKFKLNKHDGFTVMEKLVRKSRAKPIGPNDDVLPVIIFLIKNGHAPSERAIQHLAAEGTTLQMNDLKNAGIDIQQGGNSFSIAFDSGNIPMMAFLYHNGASLYTPHVVAGLHKGLKKSMRPHLTDEEVFAAHRKLVNDDAYSHDLYSAYCCPQNRSPNLADFREIPGGCTENGQTLMHLAARSGNVGDILAAAHEEKDAPLKAADLLVADKNGVTPLSILAARGEERLVFDHRLWRYDPSEAIKLNDALKEMQATEIIDPERFATEVRQRQLQEMARDGRWSLHPEKKTRPSGGKPGSPAP